MSIFVSMECSCWVLQWDVASTETFISSPQSSYFLLLYLTGCGPLSNTEVWPLAEAFFPHFSGLIYWWVFVLDSYFVSVT